MIHVDCVESTLAELEALESIDARAEPQETIDQHFVEQRVEQ